MSVDSLPTTNTLTGKKDISRFKSLDEVDIELCCWRRYLSLFLYFQLD